MQVVPTGDKRVRMMTTRQYVYRVHEEDFKSADGVIHVKRTCDRRWPIPSSKYTPHQGALECARRAAR